MTTKIKGGCTLWARKTFESEIFYLKPDKWFKIWFYLIGKVSHKDTKRFKRGVGFFKYQWIMDNCSATKDQVKHCIEYLKASEMIATQKATRGFHITILKYWLYQDMSVYESHTESHLKATQKPHSSYKNDKNDKNVRKEKELLVPPQPNEVDVTLTQCLVSWMQKNDPKSSIIRDLTERRRFSWIDSCRLLRERDGRTPEEIKLVIDFSQKDSFWKSNILSMPKLREKFNQLWLKAKPVGSLDDKGGWAKRYEEKQKEKQ